MMHVRGSRNPVGLMLVLAGTVFVFAIAAVVTYLWPQALLVGIIVACFGLIASMVALARLTGRNWLAWFAAPAVALTGIGTIMLAEDLALSKAGELTEVVVVDHTVDVKTVHDSTRRSREVYVHEYDLQDTDGQRLEQPMVFRGESGFDGIDKGDTITVLIDPSGRAPAQPADEVDFGTDIGVIILGAVLTAGAFGFCMLVVGIRGRIIRGRDRHVAV